eukprot:SAG22_NODE_9588_length_581_cov_0.858921_2_plen_114_part_00
MLKHYLVSNRMDTRGAQTIEALELLVVVAASYAGGAIGSMSSPPPPANASQDWGGLRSPPPPNFTCFAFRVAVCSAAQVVPVEAPPAVTRSGSGGSTYRVDFATHVSDAEAGL